MKIGTDWTSFVSLLSAAADGDTPQWEGTLGQLFASNRHDEAVCEALRDMVHMNLRNTRLPDGSWVVVLRPVGQQTVRACYADARIEVRNKGADTFTVSVEHDDRGVFFSFDLPFNSSLSWGGNLERAAQEGLRRMRARIANDGTDTEVRVMTSYTSNGPTNGYALTLLIKLNPMPKHTEN